MDRTSWSEYNRLIGGNRLKQIPKRARTTLEIGFTRTTDAGSFVRFFFRPTGRKKNLTKKKSTMLPQAKTF